MCKKGTCKKCRLERSIRREMKEHPWAGRKLATRIARDHLR